jgi:sensor histidine kinase YesM
MDRIVEVLDFSTGWWYPASLSIIMSLIVFWMPKRITREEIYLTIGVIAAIVWTTDSIVGFLIDLFDIGKKQNIGLPELFLYSVIPSCFAVIYINVYQEEKKLLYTAIFIALSLLAEWAAVLTGIMKLIHWNTFYSTPVYFVVYYYYLPLHLRLMRRTPKELVI